MTPTRIELVLPPWKGDVLTAWPRSQVLSDRFVRPLIKIILLLEHLENTSLSALAPPVGLEPTTLRLTAECSTDWAKEDYTKKFVPSKPNTEITLIHFP